MSNQQVLTIGQNGGVHAYSSIRAAARALSGDGSVRVRSAITNRIANGGGYVGNVYVTGGTSFVRP